MPTLADRLRDAIARHQDAKAAAVDQATKLYEQTQPPQTGQKK